MVRESIQFFGKASAVVVELWFAEAAEVNTDLLIFDQ
jgi:hypothetical protein